LVYGQSALAAIAGVALLVAPHFIGAPQPLSHDSPIPETLHHSFVVAVVLTTLVFFVLLGGLTGYFRRRLVGTA
jgi:predicted cobalt transporter CbtA